MKSILWIAIFYLIAAVLLIVDFMLYTSNILGELIPRWVIAIIGILPAIIVVIGIINLLFLLVVWFVYAGIRK